MITLRPYQIAALDELRARVAAGSRRIVLVAPTGAGKTVCAAALIRAAVERGSPVVFVAHRREIIDQTIDKLTRFDVPAGVVMADDKRASATRSVQVCSIQTLARRKKPPCRLLIIDEAHHACSKTYRDLIASYPGAFVVGLTATPWRTDRLGLADVFEGHVLAATPAQLMDSGDLVRCSAYAYEAPDLRGVHTVAGDYNQKELAAVCDDKVIIGSVVREYVQHALGKRAVVFPVNIEHSKHLVMEFNAAGVPAQHLDCSTPKTQRAEILANLASGAISVVSSVGVLVEGWDCPPAEVGILARPTKSLTLHIQMMGRLLRPSPATGKTTALFHDHAGNIMRHGLVEDPRDYSLTATPKNVLALKVCPFCHVFFGKPVGGRCPACGEIIAPTEEQTGGGVRREPKMIDGRRVDIMALRASRAGNDRHLSDRELVKVASASRRQKASEYLRLCAVAETRGFKPGFVAHQFRSVFGHWPNFLDEELDATEPARAPFIKLQKRAS